MPELEWVVETIATGTRGGVCPMVVVSREGSAFYSPATRHVMMGCDLLRSRDRGASWQRIATPRTPQYVPEGYVAPRAPGMRPKDFKWLSEQLAPGCTLHPGVWLDAQSGRLFATVTVQGSFPDGSGSVVAFSDDDGESWQASRAGEGSWDWGKLYAGPPATDASRHALDRNGYPSVVYFSATGPTLISGPNQLNYKSLDGGRSWQRVADAFDEACARRFATGFPQCGVVAPDGAIYRVWAGTPVDYMPQADKTAISVRVIRSRDEGASWEHFELPDSRTGLLGATLAGDRDGTLYLCWADSRDGGMRLSCSRDRAQTWSRPLVVPVPGVAWTSKPTIAVRAPGEVAIAVWGSAQAQGNGGDGWLVKDGRAYDGYLVYCPDMHASQPRFASTAVRYGDAPLLPDGESAWVSGEYLGAPSFAPDGAIWAGFLSRAHGGIVVRGEIRARGRKPAGT